MNTTQTHGPNHAGRRTTRPKVSGQVLDCPSPQFRLPSPPRVADQLELFCRHGNEAETCGSCRDTAHQPTDVPTLKRHYPPKGAWHDPACQDGWIPVWEGDWSEVSPCPVHRPKVWELVHQKRVVQS
jgi:hypothetical protein